MTTRDPGFATNPGTFFSTLVDPLTRQTPLANEARGNDRLEEASKLAIEYESVIDAADRAAIEDNINYAKEVKVGLESKWGIAKIMQAREFRRAATHALRFAKSKTDREQILWKGDGDEPYVVDGPNQCQIRLGVFDPSTDPTLASVANIARHLYRCYLSCRDAFPTPKKRDEWAEIVWCEASIRTGSYPGPSLKPEWFTIKSLDFLADVRTEVRQVVETSYGFGAIPESISDNAARAQRLLSNNAFIYPESNYSESLQDPYRHTAIQKAVNSLWFKNKDDDGMKFQEHFSPMPIRAMALVLAVIQCCIHEWTDGIREDSNWDESHFKGVYQLHIDLLIKLHDNDNPESGDPFEVIRGDLLSDASDYAESADNRKTQDDAHSDIKNRKVQFLG